MFLLSQHRISLLGIESDTESRVGTLLEAKSNRRIWAVDTKDSDILAMP